MQDFHPLDYPHNNLPLDESFTFAIDEIHGCNITTPHSSSSSDFSGMFDPDFFAHNHPDFLHPDTPSSASSTSEVLTPISDRGEIGSPVIGCRVEHDADVDMESSFGGQMVYGSNASHVPLDFRDPLLTMFKSTSDDLPVDWPQLLATLCDQHPEAVKWFAETGGFHPDFDQMPTSQNEHDYLMQQQSPSIYPHQHSDTLSDILSSSGDLSSLSPSASRLPSTLDPSAQIPLHQPQPVRPIPQIPLKDLAAAAAALRLTRPRGPREAHQTLSPLSLLCQPVDDSVRYQQKPLSACNVNADH